MSLRTRQRDEYLTQLARHQDAAQTRMLIVENGSNTASAWLHMTPTHTGRVLDDECITQGLRVRGLLPMDMEEDACRQCNLAMGYHQVLHPESCTGIKNVGRTTRHNALRDMLALEFNRLGRGKTANVEPHLNDDPNGPQADLFVVGGIGQLAALQYIDIRITTLSSAKNLLDVNSLVALGLDESAYQLTLRGIDAVLSRHVQLKDNTYAGLRHNGVITMQVAPFVLTTGGSFDASAWQFLMSNFNVHQRKRLKEKMAKSALIARSTLNRVYWS
jgi:hypothetical protein